VWDSKRAKNCSHERDFWTHLSQRHGALLKSIARKSGLKQQNMNEPDVLLTLYNAGLAERERSSVPELGVSIDRRTLSHVSEVFGEDNVKVLMCFSCACKEIAYSGYDKFGFPVQKGKIAMRRNRKQLQKILGGDEDEAARTAWDANLSAKRFKSLYGDAVATDPGMQADSFEWIRKVRRAGGVDTILCCPEDVEMSRACKHDFSFVCADCHIPYCNECYTLSVQKQAIPRCLTNDNYIGYVHAYIVRHKVTWLEATIACPVFSGLVTYYVEGRASERGHMMREALGRPQRAWAVRGNLFSFLLPWEKVMAQLSKCFLTGDFTEWPLDQATACEVCRVRFVRGQEAVVDKYA
jgi:hypothetical protein